MLNFWNQYSRLQRVLFIVSLLCLLGAIGSLIWDYPSWPVLVVLVPVVVLNLFLSRRGDPPAPTAQENDPRNP